MPLTNKHLSFEFFPPRTEEGAKNLVDTAKSLDLLNPELYTVTFGAGGSTREKTLETVCSVKDTTGKTGAAHISCIDSTAVNIKDMLDQHLAKGVDHLVALRGDIPSGMQEIGEFHYANELIDFIRHQYDDKFTIAVGAYPEYHPQAKTASADFLHFERKVKAGADLAFTQYFYNPDAYFYFMDQCEKHHIDIPVIPGIMPITNYTQLARFSDVCGAEIPRWIRKRLESFPEDKTDDLKAFGVEVVSNLCRKLLEGGAPGLHFYTMNKVEATEKLVKSLA